MDIITQNIAAQARGFATTAMAALMEKRSAHLSPVNMTARNRAKARVRAGVADATVAFVGDSTTVGHGVGTTQSRISTMRAIGPFRRGAGERSTYVLRAALPARPSVDIVGEALQTLSAP